MATTYEAIQTTTLGTAAASYTFSSISGAYTDLVLICSLAIVTGSPEIHFRVNSDTATNYSMTILSGNGTAASSLRQTSSSAGIQIGYNGVPNTTLGNQTSITNIQNYSNTTTYKTAISRSNNAAFGTDAIVGLWRNTAAITSITIKPTSSSFATGSVLTLYGILAA